MIMAGALQIENCLAVCQLLAGILGLIGHRCTAASTPLHEAAIKGHGSVAGQLLEARANIDAADKNGRTPLHRAAGEGHGNVVGQLLKARANVNASCSGCTPLSMAISSGHTEVARLLQAAGGRKS